MTFRSCTFSLAVALGLPASLLAAQVTQPLDSSGAARARDSAQAAYAPGTVGPMTPNDSSSGSMQPSGVSDSARTNGLLADSSHSASGPDTSAADSAAAASAATPPAGQTSNTSGPARSSTQNLDNPRNFRARSLGNTVLLTWDPVRGATYYWLVGTGVPGERITDTTFTVRNLPPGTRSYSLVAYRGEVADTTAPSRATVGIWEAPKPTDDTDLTVAVKATPDSIPPGKCARFRAELRDRSGATVDALQDGTPAHAGGFKYSLRPSTPSLRWLGDDPGSLMVCATASAKPGTAVLSASLGTSGKPLTGSTRLRITRPQAR
jgi:hypothetical protein